MFKKIIKSKTFIIAVCVISILIVRHIANNKNVQYKLPYSFCDVQSTNDSKKIFEYTGLSPWAYDDMLKNNEQSKIKKLNNLVFEKNEITKNYIAFPVTAEERLKNKTIPMASLKDGDILITFNTHTLDWRHGHAAIVTDAQNGIMLEHLSIGNNSVLSNVKSWASYPSFIILRHPDPEIAKEAAIYAQTTLADIPYSIFAGIIKKDKSDEPKPESSHCSHIVWQAYKAVGEDIDCDGGFLVTPRDISNCTKLKVVQLYGMNPDDYESRLYTKEDTK